ncbi:MAG TPA: hypothetical protein VFV58_11990 [Blastocatellia bacterium]|jgi:hypothetical protein|nr:hypothetical protein [Blastocatellia bacterium]
MLATYFASIINTVTGAAEVMTASSFSLLITCLAAMTEKASGAGHSLDIVVTFGKKEVDPAQIAGCIDDALALSVIHRNGYALYHNPMSASEAEVLSF